jgi:hypothetical protein
MKGSPRLRGLNREVQLIYFRAKTILVKIKGFQLNREVQLIDFHANPIYDYTIKNRKKQKK